MFFYEEYNSNDAEKYSAFQLQNAIYPCHFHRCYELISIISGELIVTLNEKDYALAAGDLIIIFPNQLHSFNTIDSSLFNIIIFSPEIIDDFESKYPGCIPENPILHLSPLALDKILTQNIFEQKALLYHICGLYSTQTTMIKKTASDEPTLLHQILTFVGENYHETCSLQELSTHLGYEYTYLSKYFKDKMKVSYTSYLNQLRIRQACALLKDKKHSIVDIAFQCGYDTLRTFNRNFLSIIKTTPKEYRKL